MFNYTKELVFNSNSYDGNTVFSATSGKLNILSAGTYEKEFIDGGVYISAPIVGKKAKSTFTVGVGLANLVYEVHVELTSPGRYYAEFANATTYFKRPIIVQFAGSTTAAVMANRMKASLDLAISEQDEVKPYKVAVAGSKVTIETTSPYIDIKSLTVLSVSDADVEVDVTSTILTTDTANTNTCVNPFATGAWIVENLRYPTDLNTSYFSSRPDDYPITSETYYEFTFRYKRPTQISGLSAVGQTLESVTNHVFFVKASMFNDVKSAFTTAFGEIFDSIHIHGSDSIETGSGATSTETYTVTAGDGGTITWSLGSAVTGVAINSGSGVVTVTKASLLASESTSVVATSSTGSVYVKSIRIIKTA